MTPFLLTLCKHSLLAAAVLALAAITKPLWRERYGARSRCALWLALAVFLLLPVDWSAPSAPVRVEPPAERTLLLSAQRGPSVVRTDELPRRQETVLSGAENTSPLPADPSVTFEDAYGTAPDNSAKNVPLTGLLFLLWASGMTGYTTLQIVKYKKFYRLVRRWRHETTRSDYARLLADECAALGVKRPQLLLCEAVGTPMMTGLFHPVLLLPHEDYEPAALRFILRHELCHLKRHDLAYKLVLTAANAVHWFDPLVYWMLRQADEDVELACDSRATEGMAHAERTAYGETLLAAVQAKIAPVPMTTSFGSTAERLKRRLANVLGGKKRRGLWLAALAIAAVAASALLIAWQSGTDEKTKDADVWLTMEDYALDRANAVRRERRCPVPAAARRRGCRRGERRAGDRAGARCRAGRRFPGAGRQTRAVVLRLRGAALRTRKAFRWRSGKLVQHRRWLVRQQAVRCARCACERGRLSHSVHRNMGDGKGLHKRFRQDVLPRGTLRLVRRPPCA